MTATARIMICVTFFIRLEHHTSALAVGQARFTFLQKTGDVFLEGKVACGARGGAVEMFCNIAPTRESIQLSIQAF